jgi:hypothetical protein
MLFVQVLWSMLHVQIRQKQNNGVLISQDCSKCVLNEMKLKDALVRVKHMEEVVKQDEVFSCSTCRKQKGLLDACKNCAILNQEVSYLKSSLQGFSDGKKNLNMILDQSKIGTHNCCLGFDPYAHNSRHPPTVLGFARRGEILIESEPKNTVFKSAGIMSSLNASSSKSNVVNPKPSVVAKPSISKPSTSQTGCEKYTCSFCGKDGHLVGFCFRLAHKQKKEREIAFAKRRWQKSGFNLRTTVRPILTSRSDRLAVRPQLSRRSDRLSGSVRPQAQWRSDRPRGNSPRNSNRTFPQQKGKFSGKSDSDFVSAYVPIGSTGCVTQCWIPKFLISNPNMEASTSSRS